MKIDGVDVTSCIAADFGAAVNLDPIVVRARAVDNACGQGCDGDRCSTGHTMYVFYGDTPGSYQLASQLSITPSFVDYSVRLNLAARYIVVCRGGAGWFRDDVAVDSIRTLNACSPQ